MRNKILKDFRNALHSELKIEPQQDKSSCFIIKENKKESAIKEIQFTFKNQDDAVIIQQKENTHTINMLQNKSTNCSCDFIVLLLQNDKLRVYLCEIKSSYKKEYLEEATKQIESSRLFLSYLLECYAHYFKCDDFKEIDNIQRYYIYPKIGNSNKRKPYTQDNIKLNLKPVDINNKKVVISNGYDFFEV